MMNATIASTIHFIGQGFRDCAADIENSEEKGRKPAEAMAKRGALPPGSVESYSYSYSFSFSRSGSEERERENGGGGGSDLQINLRRRGPPASLPDFMKLWSQYFIPTLKESPADAEIASHKLLVRAGLVRKLSGGLYTYLPLGLRVMQKISQICREELDAAGGIEVWMPHVHPAEVWENGPRWAAAREIMFRVDSAGAGKRLNREPEFVLGPTHEEVITPLVKGEITSYRDLPKNFYQIATKFRNEIRPRYGLMRAREFVMMDAYTFDVDDEHSIKSY